jgi:5-methylcytosine-specific restriction endonuclease McrA
VGSLSEKLCELEGVNDKKISQRASHYKNGRNLPWRKTRVYVMHENKTQMNVCGAGVA